MNLPSATRPEDYLYTLVSEPAYGWRTGTLGDGRQVLIGGNWAIDFDRDGRFLRFQEGTYRLPGEPATGIEPPGLVEGPIHIRRFAVTHRGISIEDLTDCMREFLSDPGDDSWADEERQDYPREIRGWLDDGMYVFNCGNDYFVNRAGEVESS